MNAEPYFIQKMKENTPMSPLFCTSSTLRMLGAALIAVVATVSAARDLAPTAPLENRCGWFHNPTPNNATLTDRDGEWVVSTQGGESAEGDWPVFAETQWKKTNGHYGYGCACMKVVLDRSDRRVLRIVSAAAKPLKACRDDRALPKPRQ